MRQPHHLALYWTPNALGPDFPVANIIVKMCGKSRSGDIQFGGDCTTKREIDELIDEMIQDLEDARQLAHERFDL
jgi:hypothetical protein